MTRFFASFFKESVRAIAIPAILFGLLAVAFAFSEPTSGPTGGTVYAPVNTSGTLQTKTGPLTVSGTLWGNPVVTGSSFCLPGTNPTGGCITVWPSGGSGGGITSISGSGGSATGPTITFNGSGVSQSGNTFTFSGTGSGVSQIIAGTNVTISPTSGTGAVTINASGGGSSQWITTGSNIYYNNGNVGIGTAAPTQKLDVNGDIRLNNNIIFSHSGQQWTGLRDDVTTTNLILAPWANQYRDVFVGSNGPVNLWVTGRANAIDFCIPSSGKCLSSAGGGLSGSGSTNYVSKWTGATSVGNSIIFDNGSRVGIGTAAPLDPLGWAFSLDVAGGVTASRYYDRQNNGYWVDLDSGANLSRDWLFGGNTIIEPAWDINMGVYSNKKINTGSTMQASDVWLAAPNFGSPRWASQPASGGTGMGDPKWKGYQGYQETATTDGFANVVYRNGGDQSCVEEIWVNGVKLASTHNNGDSRHGSLMAPVKKGSPWGAYGYCDADVYWTPFGN